MKSISRFLVLMNHISELFVAKYLNSIKCALYLFPQLYYDYDSFALRFYIFLFYLFLGNVTDT
jgi:hypothetical protein